MAERAYRRNRQLAGTSYASVLMPLDAYVVVERERPWAYLADAYQLSTDFVDNREAVQEAFAEAAWILELKDDWDEEESRGYEEGTMDRARDLLSRIADCCWDYQGSAMPMPWISPADDGSIDLAWRGPLRLLINIPRHLAEEPTFAALDADLELYGKVTRKSLPTIVGLLSDGT